MHARPFTPSHTPAQTAPEVPAPLHAGLLPTGGEFTGTGEQVPFLPATLHASHWPVQSPSQQTPSTQRRLAHSPSREQSPPIGERGVHTPARQNRLASLHDSSVEQPSHLIGPQIPGAQSCVRTAGQIPEPSQNSCSVAVPLVQVGARHSWLEPGIVHDCLVTPSHTPSQPVPLPTHAARGETGEPVTAVQVPCAPVKLHASHCPAQSELQHTPSTQKFDWHWPAEVQGIPAGPLLEHSPLPQKFPSAQSASEVQVVLQAVAPQVYGAHGFVVTVGHCAPLPLHRAGGVSTPAVHEPAAHCVPFAKPLSGQSGLVPEHTSGTSHAPFATRHWAPAFPATF
jgi:hypothetical protein